MWETTRALLITTTTVGKLISMLFVSDPEVEIHGTGGERFSKVSIIRNFILNREGTFSQFSKLIAEICGGVNVKSILYDVKEYYGNNVSVADLQERITSACVMFEAYPSYQPRYTQKMARRRSEREVALQRLERSAPWGSFRPMLETDVDATRERDQISLDEMEASAKKATTHTEFKYISYMLSYRLFYSIQSILQKEQSRASGAFSNYCCLSPLRTPYLDHFLRADPSIQRCLELMRAVELGAFYNPDQSLVGVIDTHILKPSQRMLEYVPRGRELMSSEASIKAKLRQLFITYSFFESEPSVPKPRLYRRYYDDYVSQLNTKMRSQITDEIRAQFPALSVDDVKRRVDNLYSSSGGLITEDTSTGEYLWDIERELEERMRDKSVAQLLELYDDTMRKLYQRSRIYLSARLCEPFSYATYYDRENIRRETVAKQVSVYRQMVAYLETEGETSLLSIALAEVLAKSEVQSEVQSKQQPKEQQPKKQPKKGPIAKPPTNSSLIETYVDGVYRTDSTRMDELERMFRASSESNRVLSLPSSPKLFADVLRDLGRMDAVREAHIASLKNRIRIEGYSEQEVDAVYEVRRGTLLKLYALYEFRILKQYYATIASAISEFRYFSYNSSAHSFGYNIHGSGAYGEGKYAFFDETAKRAPVNIDIFHNPAYREMIGETVLSQIVEAFPVEMVDALSVDYEDAEDVSAMVFLLRTLIQHFVVRFLEVVGEAGYAYLRYYVVERLSTVSQLNTLTEKQVQLHLRDLLSKENRRRKDRYDAMSESEQSAYRMYRELGIGNFFIEDTMESVEEEQAYAIEMPVMPLMSGTVADDERHRQDEAEREADEETALEVGEYDE